MCSQIISELDLDADELLALLVCYSSASRNTCQHINPLAYWVQAEKCEFQSECVLVIMLFLMLIYNEKP